MQVSRNKIAVAVLAVVVLLVIWVLSAGISDSPKKSLSAIKKAVKNHDVETLEKYVDLQSFYNEGFDSFLVASMKWERPDEEIRIGDMGFMMMFKPSVVQELVAFTRRAVEKGETPGLDSLGKLGDEVDTLGVSAWEFKRAGSAKKRSVTAIVPVTIHDRQVEKDFVFDIELHKTDSGIWRVKKIANAEDVILARMAAAKVKLEEVNAGILKEMTKTIAVSDQKIKLESDESRIFASRQAIVSFKAKNNLDKTIKSLRVAIDVIGVNGDVLFKNSATWPLELGAGEQKELSAKNSLYEETYDLLSKKENQGGKIEIVPSYIKFSDGTELRELSKLPPYKKK